MSDLRERLQALLRARTGEALEVTDLQRLPGGASRETWAFRAGHRRLVLRRDPPGHPIPTDRATEFELLRRAAEGGVPVPRVLWFEPEALGSPAFVMEHVEGETIPRRILREPEYAPALPRMAAQCGEVLARIHRLDVAGLPLHPPRDEPALEALQRYRQLLDSFGEPHPELELGMRWLQRRAPRSRRVGLVHGDFRLGNFIVGPEGIRAVLDWELAHLGDPWEDLGWLCTRSWRYGGRGEVGGFGDREELYAAYERASGEPVDREAVRWWEAFGSLKWAVICIGQAFTHLWGHVRSVELAAIGRRTCEPAHDLLQLLD